MTGLVIAAGAGVGLAAIMSLVWMLRSAERRRPGFLEHPYDWGAQ